MGSALAGVRLLVVEDEAMVAMMIETMLSDLGCVVVDVAGGILDAAALPVGGGAQGQGVPLEFRGSCLPPPAPP